METPDITIIFIPRAFGESRMNKGIKRFSSGFLKVHSVF